MNKEKELINSLRQRPTAIISKNFELPNNSGDHARSIKRDTPINDMDLVNKKYVDDEIAGLTTDHTALTNLNSANYTHLTSTNATDLTDAGNSSLHYHSADRSRANHTGVEVLPAGTATAGTAPLKFTSGTNLTTAELGAIEFDGTNFYATVNVDAETTDNHGENLANTAGAIPPTTGFRFKANTNCTLIKVTKASGCTATKAYLDTGDGTAGHIGELGTANFDGNIATFSTPPELTANEYYIVSVGSDGSNYTDKRCDANYPYNLTNVNILDDYNYNFVTELWAHTNDLVYGIQSITTATTTVTRKKITLGAV